MHASDTQRLARGLDRARREALREVDGMRRAQVGFCVGAPGGVNAGKIAQPREDPRFVERRPVGNAVAQGLRNDRRILGEALRGVALRPSARVLERLRKIPVI